MLLKNLPLHIMPFLIFIRLCLDGLAGIVFLIQGKPRHTWAIIKAHFGFYAQAPQSWKLRQKKVVSRYYSRFSIFFR